MDEYQYNFIEYLLLKTEQINKLKYALVSLVTLLNETKRKLMNCKEKNWRANTTYIDYSVPMKFNFYELPKISYDERIKEKDFNELQYNEKLYLKETNEVGISKASNTNIVKDCRKNCVLSASKHTYQTNSSFNFATKVLKDRFLRHKYVKCYLCMKYFSISFNFQCHVESFHGL